MSKQLPKIVPVYVEWVDSMGQYGWQDYKPVSTMKCTTVGHLIEKQKDRVIVACSMCHAEDSRRWNDIIEIPSVAITKFRRMRLPK